MYFFTSSTKRAPSLQESIGGAEVDNPLQLRNLLKTRWVARAESIKAVWASYEAILESLTNLYERSKDGKTKTAASCLSTKITRSDFIVCMHNVYEEHYVQDQENDRDPSKRRS